MTDKPMGNDDKQKETTKMRKLTDHIVSGDQAVQLTIEVTDEPGAGGANHEYEIKGFRSRPSVRPTIAELEELLAKGSSEPMTLNQDGSVSVGPSKCLIHFQNGPIKESGVNGITQEALLAITIDRLRSFQNGLYKCRENAIALTHCEEALMWLQRRTVERIKRGVEGTHEQ